MGGVQQLLGFQALWRGYRVRDMKYTAAGLLEHWQKSHKISQVLAAVKKLEVKTEGSFMVRRMVVKAGVLLTIHRTHVQKTPTHTTHDSNARGRARTHTHTRTDAVGGQMSVVGILRAVLQPLQS